MATINCCWQVFKAPMTYNCYYTDQCLQISPSFLYLCECQSIPVTLFLFTSPCVLTNDAGAHACPHISVPGVRDQSYWWLSIGYCPRPTSITSLPCHFCCSSSQLSQCFPMPLFLLTWPTMFISFLRLCIMFYLHEPILGSHCWLCLVSEQYLCASMFFLICCSNPKVHCHTVEKIPYHISLLWHSMEGTYYINNFAS